MSGYTTSPMSNTSLAKGDCLITDGGVVYRCGYCRQVLDGMPAEMMAFSMMAFCSLLCLQLWHKDTSCLSPQRVSRVRALAYHPRARVSAQPETFVFCLEYDGARLEIRYGQDPLQQLRSKRKWLAGEDYDPSLLGVVILEETSRLHVRQAATEWRRRLSDDVVNM